MGGEPPDLDLLRKLDAAAFHQLVDAHQKVVLGMCQAMGLRSADIDDAAAEAFAAVYQALPGFRGDAELSTWIYRIAYRSVLKVRKQYGSGAAPVLELEGRPQLAPDQAAEQTEDYAALWAAVAKLEPRQALAIEFFYRREWSVEQIAKVLDCPEGTVKTLLSRGRASLRSGLTREKIRP